MAWFRIGGAGISAALKTAMNAVLNKKFGTVLQDYAPETWPDTVNLMGPLEEKTVSGSVVTFSDGADDVPLKSCAVTIAPTLDGVSSVDVVQCGANIWNEQWETGSYNTDTGEPGYSSTRIRSKDDIYVKGVTSIYIVSPENVRCIFMDKNKTVLGSPSAVHNGVVTPTTGAVYMRWYTGAGYGGTYNNDISFNLDITDTVYHAYNGTTHTATLGRTIYGGTADVVNGTGSETWRKIVIDGDTVKCNGIYGANGNALPRLIMDAEYYHSGVATDILSTYLTPSSSVINDEDSIALVSSGTSIAVHIGTIQGNDGSHGYNSSAELLAAANAYLQSHNLTVVYKLSDANATDFTFTPVPINSRLGDNTLWSDGDLSVVYRSMGTVYQYTEGEEVYF